MKKEFLLFVCLILLGIQAFPQKVVETNYYSENAELGGEVVIKKSTKEVVGSKTIVTFEVEVPAAKAYHADFWMFPAKLKDGSLAEYSVLVNGNAIGGKIAPTVGDWHYATLSYNPTGKCDLYMKCKNVDFASWREEDRDAFPLLNVEDAIQSSPATPVYNCFSWAGGITSYREWPEDESSSYFCPIYWLAYTDYLASRGYTPVSATQDNGVVALWGLGNDDDMDNWVIQHASIRKGADANAHGYDWESKMGSLERIFHPRDALEGFSYGRIVAYFRKDPSLGYAMTLEEEIADGTSKIEYTNFNTDEKAYLAAKIDGISDNVLAQFNTLYAQWKSVTENTPYSSPDRIANCDIYRKTLSHCQSHPELIYAVYAKLEEGGIAAAKLVKDLTLDKNRDVMERIRKSNPSGKTRNGVKVYRPMLSNTVAYVKELLAKESKVLQKARNKAGHTTDISYSNAHEFDISLSKDAVSVDFTIDNASSVYLNLLDLYGNVAYSRLNGEKLQKGEYSLKLPIGKEDIYLVQLIINGRANVKKVVVNKH